MYPKYHTQGFVLDSTPFAEANKVFYILTPNFGLIRAGAQSVRKAPGKLKSGLEDYSWSTFTFIKAKNGWKITDAVPIQNLYFSAENAANFIIIVRLSSLLKKLLPEEEHNAHLFEQFMADCLFLSQHDLSNEGMKNLECLAVLRFLNSLGYLQKTKWEPFIDEKPSLDLLSKFTPLREEAVKSINQSLKESQLI